MPYDIVANAASCPSSKPFGVVRRGRSAILGCRPTREAAQRQLAALYASEGKAEAEMSYSTVKAEPLSEDRMAAWLDGRVPRRLLAIPFGGPIPSPIHARGVDLDGETFTERTDIKPDWLEYRVTDWHHGRDALMKRTPIGKADNLVMEEDGWWVDLWLIAGEKRINLIRRLVEAGGKLFGSSEPVGSLVRTAKSGEILVWPYWRQTLSTSPQNTDSILQPLKASLETAILDGNMSASFWTDVEAELRRLGTDLRATSPEAGKSGATDGPNAPVDLALSRMSRALDALGDVLNGGPQ